MHLEPLEKVLKIAKGASTDIVLKALKDEGIEIPEKTEVNITDDVLVVKGPLGELTRKLRPEIEIKIDGSIVTVNPTKESVFGRSLWGTYASHVKNMINGVKAAQKNSIDTVITLSGFSNDNPLRKLGDINLWVDSKAYNFVENMHQIWLLSIVDLIIGSREYSA